MILDAMLQRLYSSLQKGPSLNARPHNSRQRVDLHQLGALQSVSIEAILPCLFSAARRITLPAGVPTFAKPAYPESEWSEEQRRGRDLAEQQERLIKKLQDIAIDAQDYFNDHGEDALFIGFPLISIPIPGAENKRFGQTRILAPAAFIPVKLTVQKGPKTAVAIERAGDGADLLIPNPALLAWLEQQTGEELPELFEDETGQDPAREFAEILAYVLRSAGIDPAGAFSYDVAIEPIPKAEDLPNEPRLLPSAVLGLFPMTNPGLLRDTKHMMADEALLQGPVRAFLHKEALQPRETERPERDEASEPAEPTLAHRAFDEEYFIAPIDPSQSRTAQIARSAKALVIHGPPGTGKSQTITNIIGDHLARGQRVLFVCDKRTAIDVVKFRLDHCGLGHLCGVIHDATRDRQPLYLGLRERMDQLVEREATPNPTAQLRQVNDHLSTLDQELKRCYRLLHGSLFDGKSFHDLVGEWLAYRRLATDSLQLEPSHQRPITLAAIDANKTDIGEALLRAREANVAQNPFFERVALSLESYFALSLAGLRGRFANIETLAAAVDETAPEDPPAPGDASDASKLPALRLQQSASLPKLAQALDEAAEALDALATSADDAVCARAAEAAPDQLKQLSEDLVALQEPLAASRVPLEREIALLLAGSYPKLSDIGPTLLALQEYKASRSSFFAFLHFGKRKAAKLALKPLSLPLNDANADRAIAFCNGLKARWLVSDWVARFLGSSEVALLSDDALRSATGTLELIERVARLCRPFGPDTNANASRRLGKPSPAQLAQSPTCRLLHALDASERAAALAQAANDFRLAAERARRVHALIAALRADGILTEEAIDAFDHFLRGLGHALAPARGWSQFAHTIENIIRLRDGIDRLPAALQPAVRAVALQELDREAALNELAAIALRNAIRQAIEQSPELLRIDTARIDAAFDEYGQRQAEKQVLVRQYIEYQWDKTQRRRLLAGTGSRLSSDGAALRNRLFIRGKRSLKLRQMIAAGESATESDPLFDLCPVWMASPSIVAQIFPRQQIFDLIVFDEASQCRLEEALPTLLRAQRVVIAGDPKQLPPTRFFETGVVESDDAEAETVEELSLQRMSETEDLLTAALNLDVDEAFLDVHYRSQNEALIGFSNEHYYGSRLQPIPGHPRNKALEAPIVIHRVDGLYEDRSNQAEAAAVVDLVADLLESPEPPSIGIACFNINQRDLIIDSLNERAQCDTVFAARYATARQRRGRDSFEGLFVRNLENVQGDERDHIIISTTFGLDRQGKYRRNFGALSRSGGERRLNVLVTRARQAIHIITSIPSEEYRTPMRPEEIATGRHHLYGYLRYAESVARDFAEHQEYLENLRIEDEAVCRIQKVPRANPLGSELALMLRDERKIGSTTPWGNDGFCVDIALAQPALPADVTIGVLTDFNRFRKTPDPIAWEHFRCQILKGQGWRLHRVWSPIVSREPAESIAEISRKHADAIGAQNPLDPAS